MLLHILGSMMIWKKCIEELQDPHKSLSLWNPIFRSIFPIFSLCVSDRLLSCVGDTVVAVLCFFVREAIVLTGNVRCTSCSGRCCSICSCCTFL